VSEEVCREMIGGVRRRLGADVGCAVTGIAGPGGGTETKPVGLVYYGVGTPSGVEVKKAVFPGPRSGVRRRATLASLALLFKMVRDEEMEETWR
jgi:nicotinamide-nucleotide amidase